MDRKRALEIVRQHIKNESLIHHMQAVEAAMVYYAEKLDQDVDTWAIAGILHDYDWEIHPSSESHPLDGLPYLREQGVSEEILYAIAAHADHAEYPRKSLLDRYLYACDEITGMITAVALVRPSRSLYDLQASSVKKKWKDKSFAAGANRNIMAQGAAEIGLDLWTHVENVITAMRKIASVLDLEGNIAPPA
jgi:putative nucleotidyltransferase with HDIG domain